MKLLVVDTTSDRISLAVGDGVSNRGRSILARGAHDEKLFSEVERLLKKAGCRLRDLDALAAASGPGSFTGIRVGMTFVSVLSQSLGKPAAAVSLLEAEAARAWPVLEKQGARGVGVVYPAVRDELYFQVFTSGKNSLQPFGEPLWVSPEAWPKVFYEHSAGRRIALAGPAAQSALKRLKPGKQTITVWQGPPLEAADLIGPALKKLASGPAEMTPLYLKPAYYERNASRAAH